MLLSFLLGKEIKEQMSFLFRSVLHLILCINGHAHVSGSYAPKHAQILLKFCLKNNKYISCLSLKFEEDLLRGSGALAQSIHPSTLVDASTH